MEFVDDDQPTVVRLTGRHARSTAAAVVVATMLVGVAVWKPWGGGPVATAGTPSIGPVETPGAGPTGSIAQPSGIIEQVVNDEPVYQILDGIDLSFMGVSDPHPALGVAASYVPRDDLDVAAASGAPSVTPVVDWVSLGPDNVGQTTPDRSALPLGPTLDHPQTATVALAATWEPGPMPQSVTLLYLGAVRGRSSAAARAIPLTEPVASLARLALPPHAGEPARLYSFWLPLQSGIFFLPATDVPTNPGGWRTGGWPAGAYEFTIMRADGTTVRLRFVLSG
jgi:hypothetical protein